LIEDSKHELFTKCGALKKRPPKQYCCKSCGHTSTKTFKVRMIGITFATCEKCGGTISEREVYKEWEKRRSGQYDVEMEILSRLTGEEKTIKELSSQMLHVKDWLFSKSFSDLCYWGKLNINKEYDPIKYSALVK
jgi:hypothetical protein